MHMRGVVQAIEVFVVVTHGVLLSLGVAQFVNGLHLTGNAGTGTTELTAYFCIALERRMFKRRHTT